MGFSLCIRCVCACMFVSIEDWRVRCRVDVCERCRKWKFFGYSVQSCLLFNGCQCTYRSDNSVWNVHIHRPIIHTCIYQGNACKDKVLLRSFHYDISVVCVLHAFHKTIPLVANKFTWISYFRRYSPDCQHWITLWLGLC